MESELVISVFLIIRIKHLQINNYEKELEEMKRMTRQELIASLRRYSIYYTFSTEKKNQVHLHCINCHCNAERAVDSLGVHPFIVELLGIYIKFILFVVCVLISQLFNILTLHFQTSPAW